MRAYLLTFKMALFILGVTALNASIAQTGVLNPNDPIVVYNPSNPPATPPANTLAKWVKTNRLPWNTDSYKCYYYNGIVFRLKFPKTYQHNVADGKTYPLFVFFHGLGEKGTNYDNEYQLYHGGELHKNAVDNGSFDGFLMYPQTELDSWGTTDYAIILKIINNYLIPQVKVDRYRVCVDGLSAGGSGAWRFMINYPKAVAACLPISASTLSYINTVSDYRFTPIWHFQGGLDKAPTPYTSKQLGNNILKVGGNYRYTEYPNRGHSCWYDAWGEADYFPFMMRQSKLNPWPLYGRTEFCPNDIINDTLGVTPGFDGYEWRKDGVTITGANSNILVVNSTGSYDCRILNGTEWSSYSPVPVVIKLKPATSTPPIKISGLFSAAIPAPDGSTSVPLEEPAGYQNYLWQKEGSSSTLSTTRFYTATTPGDYKAQVTELNGCSSSFSPLFTVVNANGFNAPDAPFNVTATALSKTSIQLTWLQNSSPAFNETGFEIYQSTASSAYKLVQVTAADASAFSVNNLTAGVTYSYILRAVNKTAASAVTNAVSATTLTDANPPTPPTNLNYSILSGDQIQLTWNASTDDVGVTAYNIYINNAIAYTTANTSFTAYNLTSGGNYSFFVKARDAAGNTSQPSNTVSTSSNGLSYKYYEGTWNSLPDFNTLTPVKTGVVSNVTQSPRLRTISYGFYYSGTIKIPVSGTYTFRTNSDDGSKLYLNTPYSFSATALVNNDGLHSPQDRDGTVFLNAGSYSFIVTFFQNGGGANISVSWKTPQTNNSFTLVPDSVFTGSSSGTPPAPYTVDVNFNVDNPASSPWNNTNALPFEGLTLTNMINTLSKPSGANLTLLKNFTGTNPNGMNTGNNSGVYPDNVMRSSYYVDHGDTALLKIDGLNQSVLYNFTFFGSRQGTGTRVTVYQIGNQTASLNATNNTTNTVTIYNVQPDNNGAVFISVYDPATSVFGYLNSLVVTAQNPAARTGSMAASQEATPALTVQEDAIGANASIDNFELHDGITVYPNPIVTNVVVKLWLTQNTPRLNIMVTDASGKIIHAENFINVSKGMWVQQLKLNGKALPKGLYFIKASGMNDKKQLVSKFIK